MADAAARHAGPQPSRAGWLAAAPALALLVNAFVWGVSWWPFRMLQAQGLHPLWSTAFLYLIALACLLAVRPGAWRGLGLHPRLGWLMLAAGLTNVGFNWAVTVGDVVRVVLLFYLMPAWSVLLAWPMLGERPTWAGGLRLLLALAGVAVVLGTGESGWPVPQNVADWLALAAGACFALNNILLRQLGDTPADSRILAMFVGGAVLAGTTAAIATGLGRIPEPQLQASGAAVGLVLAIAFLLGNVALQYGAARMAAHATALVMLSEVVFASASSVLAGAATLSGRTLAGGVLILAAAAWAAWPERAPARAE